MILFIVSMRKWNWLFIYSLFKAKWRIPKSILKTCTISFNALDYIYIFELF